MKRASYREAIDWIANMDSAGDSDADDLESVSYLITTQLIADIFDVDALKVAEDVVRLRKKLKII